MNPEEEELDESGWPLIWITREEADKLYPSSVATHSSSCIQDIPSDSADRPSAD